MHAAGLRLPRVAAGAGFSCNESEPLVNINTTTLDTRGWGHRTPGQGQAQSKDHHQAVVQTRVGTTPLMTEPFTNRLGYAGCSQPQMVDPGTTS